MIYVEISMFGEDCCYITGSVMFCCCGVAAALFSRHRVNHDQLL